jgi:acetyl-CoA carboxylase carboxyltransferase component
MVLAEINTDKGTFHVVAEDESDARDKANKFLKNRYFSESVVIKSITILSDTKKLYSDKTLIL